MTGFSGSTNYLRLLCEFQGTRREEEKMYVEHLEKKLRYIVQAPNEEKIDSLLNIKIVKVYLHRIKIWSRFIVDIFRNNR